MSLPPFVPNLLFKLKINSSTATTRRPGRLLQGLTANRTVRRARALLLALFVIITTTTIFYTGSSSAAAPPALPPAAAASLQSVARRPAAVSGAWLLSPALLQLFTPDELTLYAADCRTEKTDFNLGDTVCVRSSIPSGFFFFRNITWIGPENDIFEQSFVTQDGQTHLFTLPGTTTSDVGVNTVDNRGTWRVDLRSADGSREATVSFDVHAPAALRADLQISAGTGDETVGVGSTQNVKVVVYNAGPDAATGVQVSASSSTGLSLQSLSDGQGICQGGVCGIASLPRGARAAFIATYNVTAPAGARVSAAATVTSTTVDPRQLSNSDGFSFSVSQDTSGTQTCTLTPPQPITVDGSLIPDPNDPSETLYGATVNYQVASEGASCAPVQCDAPSGSLFPVGTTTVTCTAASGDSTSFPVTVIDRRSFQISLNGANPMTVGCNTVPPFADPGATTNRPGLTPTAVSTVDPNVPGSYSITYTAADDNGTPGDTSDDIVATPVVRTVNVLDDSPPHITLNGDDPLTNEIETEVLTVECHAGFIDPGATAVDACDGPANVSVDSNVDPNAVGTYSITYSATDDHGTPGDPSDDLVATITRTIKVVDTTDPTITLTGGNTITVECHGAFNDPGAEATDTCAGDLDSAIQVSGTVDPNTVGTYTLTYAVSDASGNAAVPVTRTVNVVDTTAPAITVLGDNPAVVECHGSYTDAGATANDACGGVVAVTPSGSVDVDRPGTYTITYTATDGTNIGTATRTVNVVDTTAPVISINGASTMTVECHTGFTDAGATAADSCDSAVAVIATGSVDVDVPGTYTITYNASDDAGNAATAATRTVTVVDTTKPSITLNGASTATVECHTGFSDPGASATDTCDSDVAVTVTGSVDANAVGTYTLTYTATDDAGNAATPVTRTISVVDTTKPVIALNGASTMTVECQTGFADPGATAADSCDSAVPVVASGGVDVNVPGTYTITYNASDDAGNAAVPATRTVNVVDTTAPVISCPANIVVNLPANSAATSMPVSFGVTASDSCGTAGVNTSHASGANFPVGTTTVNATATDQAGNTSTCSFTVTVRYLFAGFFSPISNLPVLNIVNAGRAIPIKFSLSGNKGLDIFAAGYPASGVIACNSNDPAAEVTETTLAGGSSLGYEAGSDRYHYVWKTESAWAGTCRQLVVKLNDGSEHRANFKFR